MHGKIYQNSQQYIRIRGWGLFLFDAITTYIAIRYYGFQEGNPIVQMAMDACGMGMGLAVVTAGKCVAWTYLTAFSRPLALWTWWVYVALLGGAWIACFNIPTQ